MVHEIPCGPYPSPLGDFTGGRVLMDVARGVFGVALIFAAVVILLTLLNRRDRRASRLHHIVLEQLALPELRGHVGVHIQCGFGISRMTAPVQLGGSSSQAGRMAACMAYWDPRADTPSRGDGCMPGVNGRRVG